MMGIPERVGIQGTQITGWQDSHGVVMGMGRDARLFQVVLALCSAAGFAGELNRGQEESDQDSDDRNSH